jgi:hypothetical protein
MVETYFYQLISITDVDHRHSKSHVHYSLSNSLEYLFKNGGKITAAWMEK